MTYKEALERTINELKENLVPDAEVDAALLLEHVSGMTRARMLLESSDEMPKMEESRLIELTKMRCDRIPLQHLTGSQEFMGLPFQVNASVLVPRQDTEILVEETLKVLKGGEDVLDVCTGSGCILISLLHYCKGIHGTGVDISEDALSVARANAALNQVEATWVQSDLFRDVDGEFDLIVSNPPYIRSDVIPTLMPEVRDHDPLLALDGGEDGLDFYRRITREAKDHLKIGGRLHFEIGVDEAEDVTNIMLQHGFSDITIAKDYSQNDRVVMGHL